MAGMRVVRAHGPAQSLEFAGAEMFRRRLPMQRLEEIEV